MQCIQRRPAAEMPEHGAQGPDAASRRGGNVGNADRGGAMYAHELLRAMDIGRHSVGCSELHLVRVVVGCAAQDQRRQQVGRRGEGHGVVGDAVWPPEIRA